MRPQRLAVGVAEACELPQRALPVRSERLEALNAGAICQRAEHVSLARRHDGEARTRVAQQVIKLVGRAGGVDRHKHRTQAQAGDIQQHRFRRLFHSRRDPIAARHAATHQCGRETRGLLAQRLVAELSTRQGPEEQSAWVRARGVLDPLGRIDDGRGLRIHAHDRSGHDAISAPIPSVAAGVPTEGCAAHRRAWHRNDPARNAPAEPMVQFWSRVQLKLRADHDPGARTPMPSRGSDREPAPGFTSATQESLVAKPNYHQARKQKELARKARQQEKQQRRSARPGARGENPEASQLEAPATPPDPTTGSAT